MIRRFEIRDAQEVSDLIAKTMRTTNIKDYSSEYVENDIKALTPEYLVERSKWSHFYVACIDNIIVGCGAIGPYWGKEDESSLFTIFLLPEYQGKGIGRKIFETRESVDLFLRARGIDIRSSLAGCVL